MRTIVTFFCLFLMGSVYAQKTIHVQSDWVAATSIEDALIISKRVVDVEDMQNGMSKSYYQLRFKNLTNQRLEVSWDFKLDYDNFNERQSMHGESNRTIVLEANETYIPDNYNSNTKPYFVFRKFLNISSNVVLNSIEFENLTSNPR